MSAYYNEHDPFAAAWLRELIKAGQIAPGEVDERSIEDVLPNELRKFTQCHFFAGIGVWSYALRSAGWPDDRPVWTGSCPCQPFSAAGKRTGVADERHLWPALYFLITQCRPVTLFGEQVSSKDGLAWFDTVQSDLEAANYAVGKADLCSAGFGAPHIRQRLYFVGTRALDNATDARHNCAGERDGGPSLLAARSEQSGIAVGRLDNSATEGLPLRTSETVLGREACRVDQRSGHADIGLANNNNTGLEGRLGMPERAAELPTGPRGLVNGFWAEADWIWCRDGKFRPIEPGVAPLATGITNRVGKLRGYGNALTAEVAKGFIEAFIEAERG